MSTEMFSREELQCAAAEVADNSFAVVDHQQRAERREEGGAVVELADGPNARCGCRRRDHVEIIRSPIRLDNGGHPGGAVSALRHCAGSQRSTIRAPGRSRSGIA